MRNSLFLIVLFLSVAFILIATPVSDITSLKTADNLLEMSPGIKCSKDDYETYDAELTSMSSGFDGNPAWATESLVIRNCFFNDLTTHVDTQGNQYQDFSIYDPIVGSDPQLNSFYQPIWNTTTMSPCIDTGDGSVPMVYILSNIA